MKNVIVAIMLAVLGLGGIGLVVIYNNQKANNASVIEEVDGSGSEAPVSSSQVLSGNVSVGIKDFSYKSADITIKKGTIVTWTNRDSAKHDITVDKGDSAAFTGSGNLLPQGSSYVHTFNEVGTFSYHCSPHPYMKAKVTVVE